MTGTLLDQLRSLVAIDVDSMDPAVARRHTANLKFVDMTSNQAIVMGTATPEILKRAVDYAKAHGGEVTPQRVIDVLVSVVRSFIKASSNVLVDGVSGQRGFALSDGQCSRSGISERCLQCRRNCG